LLLLLRALPTIVMVLLLLLLLLLLGCDRIEGPGLDRWSCCDSKIPRSGGSALLPDVALLMWRGDGCVVLPPRRRRRRPRSSTAGGETGETDGEDLAKLGSRLLLLDPRPAVRPAVHVLSAATAGVFGR
jgi:hypothetical protein